MSGTAANPAAPPVCFTSGLSALCSMYMALLKQKGCDLLMCSTAYGGSSQLTDLIAQRTPTFSKSTFDIQGGFSCVIDTFFVRENARNYDFFSLN